MFTAYRRFKKRTPLRNYTTPGMVRLVKNVELAALGTARKFRAVRHRSRFQGVAHVGLQKTGSVWFREMFSDLEFYQYSGLAFRDQAGRKEVSPLPIRGAYAPIRRFEVATENALTDSGIAVLCIVRDPNAMLLSWIKSTSNYHVTSKGEEMFQHRRELGKCGTLEEKISYAVDYFQDKERFQQYERLVRFCDKNPNAHLAKYEDCISDANETFSRIFTALDIGMPDDVRVSFLQRHSFEAYSGRKITDVSKNKQSSLQGQTHLEAAALSEAARNKITDILPDRLRQLYSIS